MNTLTEYALTALIIMSAFTFLLYGADNRRARKGRWRVSEKTLLLCALLMGAPGAIAGMRVFRHKVRKWKFKLLVPVCLIINAAVIWAAWRLG